MEGERRRLIDPALTRRLRDFAGTEFAQAAMSRTLPPGFSRAELLAELADVRARLPANPLRERVFGLPAFLDRPGAEARTREWELSRATLLEAFRGGIVAAESSHYSFSHSDGLALAIVIGAGSAESPAWGIGVDLERRDRAISDAAFARFHRPEELVWVADRLDHWVLKEAAFKAHSRSGETLVADYVVTGRGARADEFAVLCANGPPERFRACLGAFDEYRYAFALRTPGV